MTSRIPDASKSFLEGDARLAAVRRQTAVVRALLDHLEHSTNGRIEGWHQLADEMARLGCASLEVASTLAAGTQKERPR
jgi:hypothetical protein